MYYAQHHIKIHITDYMTRAFPKLRGGDGVDENTREAAIWGAVEMQCSVWATRYIFEEGDVEKSGRSLGDSQFAGEKRLRVTEGWQPLEGGR